MPPLSTWLRRIVASVSLSLLSLALSGSFASVAAAQQPTAGTFSISPSRRDLVGRPPANLVPTQVRNTTRDTYAVRVFAVLLRQDVTGAFQFTENPRALNAARTILGITPTRFALAPGQSRQVALRWQLLPGGARATYVGVIFQGQPQFKDKRSVPAISRLLSINFLRLPGRYHPDGTFTALHAIQFAPRVLRLLPRIRNTGDVVAAPQHGRVAVRDATGRAVFKGRFTGDVILPGAQREFAVDLRQVLPAGTYTAKAAMSFGAHRNAKISVPFRLVGPNELPTPSVRIDDFAGHADAGGPANVTGTVKSVGSAPVSLKVSVSLFRVALGQAGARPLSTRRVSFVRLAPKSERPLDLDLADGLAKGQYRVVARYTDPTGASQEITSDFAASKPRSFLDRLKLFFDRHLVAILVAIAAVCLLALVLALLRRQRRLEAELRDARGPRDPNRH